MDIMECSREYWDDFVDASPEGTVFNKSFFLESYNLPVKYFICRKGQEDISGFAFAQTSEGIEMMPFLYAGGIIFKDLSSFKNYRKNETVFLSLEAWASFLFAQFKKVEFSCYWAIEDMRPFDWLNYHERQKGYFQISIQHTLQAIDTGFLEKESVDASLVTQQGRDVEALSLNLELNYQEIGKEIIKNLVKANAGRLYVTCQKERILAVSFFVFDSKQAYYFAGKQEDCSLSMNALRQNFIEASLDLRKELVLKSVDLIGVEVEKIQLGLEGHIRPYYQIKKTMI